MKKSPLWAGIGLASLELLYKRSIIVGVWWVQQQNLLNDLDRILFLSFLHKDFSNSIQLSDGIVCLPSLHVMICQGASQDELVPVPYVIT